MQARLNLVELLVLLRTFREIVKKTFPGAIPDFNDPKEVFLWLRRVVEIAAQLARLTPSKVDDAVAAWLLANVLANEGSFLPYYDLFKMILELVRRGERDTAIAAKVLDTLHPADLDRLIPPDAAVSASGAPIDRIMTIIRLIRLLLELFTEDNQKAAEA